MLEIDLDKTHLASGETCSGRVRLHLMESLEANCLVASLTASRLVRKALSTEPATRDVLFSASTVLGGATTYLEGTYEFQLEVPSSEAVQPFREPPSFAMRLLGWLGAAVEPVQWELEVRLERRLRRDVVQATELEVELADAA